MTKLTNTRSSLTDTLLQRKNICSKKNIQQKQLKNLTLKVSLIFDIHCNFHKRQLTGLNVYILGLETGIILKVVPFLT